MLSNLFQGRWRSVLHEGLGRVYNFFHDDFNKKDLETELLAYISCIIQLQEMR